jgi:hypothetical protein
VWEYARGLGYENKKLKGDITFFGSHWARVSGRSVGTVLRATELKLDVGPGTLRQLVAWKSYN